MKVFRNEVDAANSDGMSVKFHAVLSGMLIDSRPRTETDQRQSNISPSPFRAVHCVLCGNYTLRFTTDRFRSVNNSASRLRYNLHKFSTFIESIDTAILTTKSPLQLAPFNCNYIGYTVHEFTFRLDRIYSVPYILIRLRIFDMLLSTSMPLQR